MIGQVVKETVLINSAEIEKEKVAGGVKLNLSQAVKDQLAQIEANKTAIETIAGDIDVDSVASITLDYVPGENGNEAHLAGDINTTLANGDIIVVEYKPTVAGAPEDFSGGGIAVILTKDGTDTTYYLKCDIEKEQTKLMKVELGEEFNYLDDGLLTLGGLNNKVTANTAAIAAINAGMAEPKRTRKTIELAVENWTLNSSTNLYEYTVTDANVTVDHLIEVVMDLANQAKLTDGYVESFAGSYKFYTSVAPTEAITATVIFELTKEAVGE